MSLNIIEQARLNRRIGGLRERLQAAEAFFSGVPISTARIGDATITSAKIADLSVTTAKIANATIENAKINDLDASKITTGTLSADRIAASSITATKLNVSTLSAITSDIGSVNAGTVTGVTITGGTVRTVDSSSRVEISGSPERFYVYDSGNKRVAMGAGNVVFYGTAAIRLYDASSNLMTQWDASSSSFNLIQTVNNGLLYINHDGSGDIYFVADDTINLIAPTVRLDTGTKTAIVLTENGYRALYCAEAPGVWFMDFYKSKPDPMFSEVTEGKQHVFKCINGKKLVFAKRKGYAKTRFTKKTSVEFERNSKLYA
jgi:hypothetical protein